MPSIFDHDNFCWGVKKSVCSVFHFDSNEEFQTRKLTELSSVPHSNTQDQSYNSVHYSVSANGYYGYQPHTTIQSQTNDHSAMDIDESMTLTLPTEDTNLINCRPLVTSNTPLRNINRKRQMRAECMENAKRMRAEEALEVEERASAQESAHKEYFSHPKCLMGHFM